MACSVGVERFAGCTAMCGGVAFLIPMRPEGRKAGGKKLKPRGAG